MTKTATITCEFEYRLQIGQLAPQDANLVREVTGFGLVYTDKFYSVAQAYHGEILPESELDHLTNLVKDFLYGKLQTSLPNHFASNGGAKIVGISVRKSKYQDTLFVDPRNLRVYMIVRVIVVIEVTLDDDREINREKLFKLIGKRSTKDCWYSELDKYLSYAEFGELEIEYR